MAVRVRGYALSILLQTAPDELSNTTQHNYMLSSPAYLYTDVIQMIAAPP